MAQEPIFPQISARRIQALLELPLRRPWHMLLPLAAVTCLAVVVTFSLQPKYRSSTVILVERAQVPDNVVPRLVADSGRRLSTLKQEVLSRTRLERVVSELNPFPNPGDKDLAALMREYISIRVVGNDAFSITFVHTSPTMAQRVTARLAALFIEEASHSRAQQVDDAAAFIEQELGEARRQLEEQEEAVRVFKERRMGTLPEQLQANLATLARLQREQQAAQEGLRAARLARSALNQRATSVEMGGASGAAALEPGTELARLRQELTSLRSRYTSEHPDVKAVQAQIDRLEHRLASPNGEARLEDPVAASLRAEIRQADLEILRLEDKERDIEEDMTRLQSRVERTPRTEQELAGLTRDYTKLKENYAALLKRKLDAEMAGSLEERWKGEQFRVLDPANLPERPYFPPRVELILAGILLGTAAGFGLCVLSEMLDHSVKDVEDLESVLSIPVLAAVPHAGPLRGRARLLALFRRHFAPPSQERGAAR